MLANTPVLVGLTVLTCRLLLLASSLPPTADHPPRIVGEGEKEEGRIEGREGGRRRREEKEEEKEGRGRKEGEKEGGGRERRRDEHGDETIMFWACGEAYSLG